MSTKRTVWTVPAEVVRVIDGDTVVLNLDLGWRVRMEASCRLSGVDCPELRAPGGAGLWARDSTIAWLSREGSVGAAWGGWKPGVVFVSKQLDKYGRPLGEIWIGTEDLTSALLDAGHVKVKPVVL